MITRTLTSAIAALLLSTSIATSAEFNVVKGHRTSIQMTGDIVDGDAAKLRKVLNYRASLNIATQYIILDSPGGKITPAVYLADVINYAGISTVVDGYSTCSSACFIVYAAGVNRYWWTGARIGVHSASTHFAYDGSDAGIEDQAALAATVAMARLLSGMGVPSGIVGKMVAANGETMAWLTPADVRGWAIEAK